MATYQCVKCGNTFEETKAQSAPEMKNKMAKEDNEEKKCCPSCAEMGEMCEEDEESKADRYD